MIRRRRPGRTSPAAADGELVIHGRIRARLLGLPLLDLDAHIVVENAPARPPLSPATSRLTTARPGAPTAVRPPAGRASLPNGAGVNGARPSALGRAVRLLGEGSTALDDARRIRRQALAPPDAPHPDAAST